MALPSHRLPLIPTGRQDYDVLVIGGGSGGLACAKEGTCLVSCWDLQRSGVGSVVLQIWDVPLEAMGSMLFLRSWSASLQGPITLPGSPQQSVVTVHCALLHPSCLCSAQQPGWCPKSGPALLGPSPRPHRSYPHPSDTSLTTHVLAHTALAPCLFAVLQMLP